MRYKINFYLDKSKAKSETNVLLNFGYNGKRIRILTAIKINPKDWDKKRQTLKTQLNDYTRTNKYLNDLKKLANDLFIDCINQKFVPEHDEFKQMLLNAIKKSYSKPENSTFYDYFKQFVEYQKKETKERTILKYNTFIRHIKRFENKTKYKVSFDTINDEFYYQFKDYFFDTLGQLNSTVERYLQNLKTFMKWSFDKGLHTNLEYCKFKFNFQIESTIIYLTKDEREKQFNFDLTDNKRLDAVRDIFILGCYTGLRFSDLELLKTANIINDSITFTSYKSLKGQMIPLNPFSKFIIDKYINETGFLPIISNQKLNEYLKELGKLVGINTPTQKIQFLRKKRIETLSPKYEFMTTHTARRTFGILYLQDGGRIELLQRLFAHSKIQTTMKYLGITGTDLKNDMKKVFANAGKNTKLHSIEMIEVAKNLLKNNIQLSIISYSTGLSIAEIESISK